MVFRLTGDDTQIYLTKDTCVSAAADLDRAAKECRNLLGADATKSARPSSIIQIDRNLLETKLDRLVAEKVTEPLNAMPGASGRRDRQRRQIRARRGAEGVPRRPLRPEPDRQGRQARPEGAQAQGRGLSNPRSSSATDGARKASTRRYLDRSRLDDKLAEAN